MNPADQPEPPKCFTVIPGIGCHHIHSADAQRNVATCVRELDAKMVAKALNDQRAANLAALTAGLDVIP